MYSFPNLEPDYCSMSGSNCCFLTCIQDSQEAGQVVWYSHLLNNYPVWCDPYKDFGVINKAQIMIFQFVVMHIVKGFSVVIEAEVDFFVFGIFLPFL